jgi:hypothetical protein
MAKRKKKSQNNHNGGRSHGGGGSINTDGNKRPRHDDSTGGGGGGGDLDFDNSKGYIDPTTGQRGAFPGLDGHDGDFYGPAYDGLDYIRMVR